MPIVYYTQPGAAAGNDEPANPPFGPPWTAVPLATYQAAIHAMAHANVANLRDAGIGKIEIFTSGTLPPNYLPCDGASFLTNDWPSLHAVLGGNNTPNLSLAPGGGGGFEGLVYAIRAR